MVWTHAQPYPKSQRGVKNEHQGKHERIKVVNQTFNENHSDAFVSHLRDILDHHLCKLQELLYGPVWS